MLRSSRFAAAFAVVAFVGSLSGCASSVGNVRIAESAPAASLSGFPHLDVVVDSKEGVPLANADRDRILSLILKDLRRHHGGLFQTLNEESPIEETLVLQVTVTRYDEGNSFARFMLAGLGAMHINADVALSEAADRGHVLGRYAASKTFAWGGMYGAGTTIKEIEPGFAEAVVSGITKIGQ